MVTSTWSANELRRLGASIRDGKAKGTFPSYDEVRLRYAELAVEVQIQISSLDWRPLLGRRRFEVTSRAKTIDTLREKLQRDRSTPLSRVQDIAGVRFEAEMSLSQQRAVAETIARVFEHDSETAVHDLRERPNCGYRALHVWLRLPERVEVQVRTHLQGAWANSYEEAGDLFGREIRYGALPVEPLRREVVQGLQMLSLEHISEMEQQHDRLFLDIDEHENRCRRIAHDLGLPIEEVRHLGPLKEPSRFYDEQEVTLLHQERELYEMLKQLTEAMRTMKFPKGAEK